MVNSSDIIEDKQDGYNKALQYWSNIPATVDGVLGGFGFISDNDIHGSELFLNSLFSSENAPGHALALDCGAGIGRITKYLLTNHFETIDIVEPDEKFLNNIKNFLEEKSNKLGNLYKHSLQDFYPEKEYNVIWNQWVLGHLSDEDLVEYLVRCRNSLGQNGVIIVKENVTSSGKTELDDVDAAITRPLKKYLEIFKKAKLKRVKQCKQTNFPDGLYPVYMFALVPQNETC